MSAVAALTSGLLVQAECQTTGHAARACGHGVNIPGGTDF